MNRSKKLLAFLLSISVVASSVSYQDFSASAEETIDTEGEIIDDAPSDENEVVSNATGIAYGALSEEVDPDDYKLTPAFNEETGHFESCTVTYKGEMQKSRYLLIQITAPEEGAENPQPTYTVADPSQSMSYSEYMIVHFDTMGIGTLYYNEGEKEKYLINVYWGSVKTPYYVWKAQILATGKAYVARTDADGKYHHISANGQVEELYNGYFTDSGTGHVALNGVLQELNANYTYYLFNPNDTTGKTNYNMTLVTPAELYADSLLPEDKQTLKDTKLYRIQRTTDSAGEIIYKGIIYTATNVLPIYRSKNETKNTPVTTNYFVEKGKILFPQTSAKANNQTYVLSLSNKSYRIKNNGQAVLYQGFFQNRVDGHYYFTDSSYLAIKNQNLFATREKITDTADNSYYYQYTICDPQTAGSLSYQNTFLTDKNGYTTTSKTGIVSLTYNGETKDYYLKSGKILVGNEYSYLLNSSINQSYSISTQGIVEPGYTGYFKDLVKGTYHFVTDGALRKSRYFLAVNSKENGKTTYTIISPKDAAKYPNAVIYYANSSGIASKYTGSKIVSFTYGDTTLTYDVLNGKVNTTGTKTVYKTQSGIRYSISKTGCATKFGGVYNNYYYYNGKIKTATAAYYAYYNGYIYKVSTAGKIAKYYKDKKSKTKYYIHAWGNSGKQYLVYAEPNTAKATVVIADKTKTTTYTKTVNKLRLKVSYSTGVAVLFTGVHSGSYYENGAVKTASATYYRVYNGYVYQISSKGVAQKYIRDKSKTTTYKKYINGLYYVIYYKDGKVKQTITSAETRQALIDKAFTYLGVHEGEAAHKEIVNTYNDATSGYNVKYTDSWCATFVSAMFVKCGLTSITALECSCGRQVELWQKMGVWIENDAYVPKPGDIIYYHWNCTVSGDCKTWPGHVGIVVSCVDGFITVIEGNTSDSVGLRYRTVDESCIRGYASPKY